MKICIISDTHSYHRKIEVPDADVLIHCGDHGWRGELDILEDFAHWMGDYPHKHKICILGNHDTFEIRHQDLPKLSFEKNGIKLLHNEGIEIDGLLFWGSPFTPRFGSWAWMRGRHEMAKIWERIPDQTNVLITHGPPYGKLDKTAHGNNAGCQDLWHRIKQLNDLKLHCFGHIHEGAGQLEVQGVKYVNAASCDVNYDPINKPIVIEL